MTGQRCKFKSWSRGTGVDNASPESLWGLGERRDLPLPHTSSALPKEEVRLTAWAPEVPGAEEPRDPSSEERLSTNVLAHCHQEIPLASGSGIPSDPLLPVNYFTVEENPSGFCQPSASGLHAHSYHSRSGKQGSHLRPLPSPLGSIRRSASSPHEPSPISPP